MASALAWLDSSREDQQRVRELLNMFNEQESRDELGIGQIRDAFSDLLFPGTPPSTPGLGTCSSSRGGSSTRSGVDCAAVNYPRGFGDGR